ncbi:MAG TPA: hypothetical protein VGO58_14005 [Chitinophagaceae bacterium]|jgi:hypothetical protein|nr:hypothetical protein [Chitinophagaceae bacterium]
MSFIIQLKQRNPILFWFGIFNMLVGIACLILMQVDDRHIRNVNRWLKPMKFYFSVGLMILTMGWLLYYLDDTKKIKRFTWILVISMFFENGLIIMQSIRGTTSHFNSNSSFDTLVFSLMGIFILVFTIACVFICIAFFRQKQFAISDTYLWGIRLGLLFFIIFSLEGGMMLSILKHTVGAPDGGPGLPLVNWSSEHGDLRIAHFAGIHSLQALPLLGFYIAKTKKQIILLSLLYFAVVTTLFVQAITGNPLFF